VSTQCRRVYIYKIHDTTVIKMSLCNEIYSKHIHSECIFGRSRQKSETHINDRSAFHVGLFQDSHLHTSHTDICT
jgi:hypothetical protein